MAGEVPPSTNRDAGSDKDVDGRVIFPARLFSEATPNNKRFGQYAPPRHGPTRLLRDFTPPEAGRQLGMWPKGRGNYRRCQIAARFEASDF